MKTLFQAMSFLVMVSLMAGCSGSSSTGESQFVETSKIYPVFSVVSDDLATTASAVFYKITTDANGNAVIGNSIELDATDEMLVEGGSEIRKLSLDIGTATPVTYSADFNASGPGDIFDFRFVRQLGTNAEATSITLPDDFSIATPAGGASFGKDDEITLTWTAVADEVAKFTASVSCTDGSSSDFVRQVTTNEEGAISFITSNIFSELTFASNCTLSLFISKEATEYAVDSAYASGGLITGVVDRNVSVTITP